MEYAIHDLMDIAKIILKELIDLSPKEKGCPLQHSW